MELELEPKTLNALRFIIEILNRHKIDYQISGGFAAKVYGSSRKLADIDIDINQDNFDQILFEVKEYIIFGPEQYVDENWDLGLMTLDYNDQLIDIDLGKSKIFDHNTKQWISLDTDFSNYTKTTVGGIDIVLIKKENLINYKSKLLREVDVEDIRELSF